MSSLLRLSRSARSLTALMLAVSGPAAQVTMLDVTAKNFSAIVVGCAGVELAVLLCRRDDVLLRCCWSREHGCLLSGMGTCGWPARSLVQLLWQLTMRTWGCWVYRACWTWSSLTQLRSVFKHSAVSAPAPVRALTIPLPSQSGPCTCFNVWCVADELSIGGVSFGDNSIAYNDGNCTVEVCLAC